MEIYKEKFTSLEREILRFLFVYAGQGFNQRQIALGLDVSSTAIANSICKLEKENLIKLLRKEGDNRILIELNKDNSAIFHMKRVENLRNIYESGLIDFLSEKLGLSTIILFGSYSLGEDILNSDIDIAIIGAKEKKIELKQFEEKLKRDINLNFYNSLNIIETNLKSNILNGITLKGGVQI